MIKTFSQAVKFIEQFIPTPDKKHPGELGIKRMEYLMELFGNPQLKYPTIHVGGTSGKGSTATIIASILSTKYKVGLHTSPHLVKICERLKIFTYNREQITNSKFDISDNGFVELLNKIIPTIKELEKSKYGAPSYFEIVTAMAFLHFYLEKVDVAVIEVGMGGRFDATNVIKPLVAVLTNVGLDHTEILGNIVEKISEDKVGIIKSGSKVVTGVKQKSVIEIVNAKMQECKNAELSLLIPPPGRSPSGHLPGVFEAFSYKVRKLDSEGCVFDYKGERLLINLKLKLLGEHQVENAVLAIRAVELLSSRPSEAHGGISREYELEQVERFLTSFEMTERDIRLGLLNAFIPGRLEIINKKPLVILDGAHNPDKVKALVSSIRKIFPKKKITSIIAIKNDKNAEEMLLQLLNISDKVIFTKFHLKADVGIINSYDPKELLIIAQTLQHRYTSRHTKVVKEMLIIDNAKKALEKAIKYGKPDDLILVTGSLYLVGEMRKFLISNY